MHLTDAVADALLEEVLARRSLAGGPISVNSIPVAATEEHPPMILHLLPVRGAANDIFSQATSLLVVTPVDRAVVPTAKVLQGLFDLTPAEARVARGIGEAQTVEALALSAGVSIETVRSQLKAVLSKTGLSRQQELINLLAGNMLPGVQNSSLSLTGRMERPKMPSKFSMLFIFAADRGLFIFPSDGKSFCLSWS